MRCFALVTCETCAYAATLHCQALLHWCLEMDGEVKSVFVTRMEVAIREQCHINGFKIYQQKEGDGKWKCSSMCCSCFACIRVSAF